MHVAIWIIALGSILLMLLRPFGRPEWVWVCGGAVLLLVTRLITPGEAWTAVQRGNDVYLFLAGMMLLSEIARREGVFDWLAAEAVAYARHSAMRLFLLIYAVGVVVTTLLSNDATAVVLTPAVFAAVRRAKVLALPYLYACAFIANAASFVLPISNPANLVLYSGHPPHLGQWVAQYAAASLISVGVTLGVLVWIFRGELAGSVCDDTEAQPLTGSGRMALAGLLIAVIALLGCSAFGVDLGVPTLAAAVFAVVLVAFRDRAVIGEVGKHVAWGVLPLVAGLFVMVEALNLAGALTLAERGLRWCAGLPAAGAKIVAASAVALLSNAMNNLPVGLASAAALRQPNMSAAVHHAVLVGVDLGPNLSVTGSLATILWLLALRRDGLEVTAWQFLKVGAMVVTPALILSALAVR